MLLSSFCTVFALCIPLVLSDPRRYHPPTGPAFLTPRDLASNARVKEATRNMTAAFDQLVRGNSEEGPIGYSFSITVVSADDKSPLFSYQYTANNLNLTAGSVRKVTADSVFRIASITKMLTVYALLLQGNKIRLDEPITSYVPEIAEIARRQKNRAFNPVTDVQWTEITVGDLAGQMAGIVRES